MSVIIQRVVPALPRIDSALFLGCSGVIKHWWPVRVGHRAFCGLSISYPLCNRIPHFYLEYVLRKLLLLRSIRPLCEFSELANVAPCRR
jgi:hypothetical protein